MPTQLDALPVELCAHIALFLDRHRPFKKRDFTLLALRSVSRASLEAVRRAIKSHPRDHVRFDSTWEARRITAVGQILGSGCKRLAYIGPSNATPPEAPNLNALPTRRVWFLTGSPVLNNPIELYPLLRSLDPYGETMPTLRRYTEFRERYCRKQMYGSIASYLP